MVHTTPTKVLLTTTWRPLGVQLSGSLAQGARLLDQCLHAEPTPQQMAQFESALSALVREVGRRIMAWVLHHVEPENTTEAPSRVQWEGQVYRRRAQHRSAVATLFGIVDVGRRLDEPLARGVHAMHPLALQVGVEAGGAPLGSAPLEVKRPQPALGQALVRDQLVLGGWSKLPTGPPTTDSSRNRDRCTAVAHTSTNSPDQ